MDNIDAIVAPRIDDPTARVVSGARVRTCAQCAAEVWVGKGIAALLVWWSKLGLSTP